MVQNRLADFCRRAGGGAHGIVKKHVVGRMHALAAEMAERARTSELALKVESGLRDQDQVRSQMAL